jgi:hypothetical protein
MMRNRLFTKVFEPLAGTTTFYIAAHPEPIRLRLRAHLSNRRYVHKGNLAFVAETR